MTSIYLTKMSKEQMWPGNRRGDIASFLLITSGIYNLAVKPLQAQVGDNMLVLEADLACVHSSFACVSANMCLFAKTVCFETCPWHSRQHVFCNLFADVAMLMAELGDWHTAISYCGMNFCATWATPNTER